MLQRLNRVNLKVTAAPFYGVMLPPGSHCRGKVHSKCEITIRILVATSKGKACNLVLSIVPKQVQ